MSRARLLSTVAFPSGVCLYNVVRNGQVEICGRPVRRGQYCPLHFEMTAPLAGRQMGGLATKLGPGNGRKRRGR